MGSKLLFKRKIKHFFLEDKKLIKEYPKDYNLNYLQTEYNNSRKVYDALKSSTRVRTPQPLNIDTKRKSIAFEYIYSSKNLEDLFYDKKITDSSLRKIFFLIGFGLAKIHRAYNGKIITNKDIIKLYDDISINNILIKKNVVYFIDMQPSRKRPEILTGEANDDLSYFVLSFERLKIPKYFKANSRNVKLLEFAFLEGYIKETKMHFDYESYLISKKTILSRMKKIDVQAKNILGILYDNFLLRNIDKILKDDFDYRKRYKNTKKADKYDKFYDQFNQYALIWDLFEKNALKTILNPYRGMTLLDFATGSGKVIVEIEKIFKISHGVDVAKPMLALARKRVKHSQLICQDITTSYSGLLKNYDVVTAFRFFLNANSQLRYQAMFNLSLLLNNKGIIVFNNHGSRWSIHGIYACIYRLLGLPIRTLSDKDVRVLLSSCGMELVSTKKFGYLPFHLAKLTGSRVYRFIDIILQKIFFGYFSYDRIYVARKVR